MIIRIVKLKFHTEKVEKFLDLFDSVVTKVNSFPGCQQMYMVRSIQDPTLFFTYSHWNDEKALSTYKDSDLFKSIWPTIKPWFSDKAEAWSTEKI